MKNAPAYDPTVDLCLGSYGSCRGWAASYERGTPVPQKEEESRVAGKKRSREASLEHRRSPAALHQSGGGGRDADSSLSGENEGEGGSGEDAGEEGGAEGRGGKGGGGGTLGMG